MKHCNLNELWSIQTESNNYSELLSRMLVNCLEKFENVSAPYDSGRLSVVKQIRAIGLLENSSLMKTHLDFL